MRSFDMDKKKVIAEPKIPNSVAKDYFNKTRHIKTIINPISPEFVPEYKTEGAACCDLKANIKDILLIGVGETVKIPVGFKMQLPSGYEAQIRARSGLASKGLMVTNGIGTIDEDNVLER